MIHFALGHFPIALLVSGATVLVASLALGSDEGRNASLVMLAIGAGASVPTVAAGLWISSGHAGQHGDALAVHRLLGIATMSVSLLALLSNLMRRRVPNADLACNLLFVTAAILAGATGYAGGEMVHGAEAAELHSHAGGAHADEEYDNSATHNYGENAHAHGHAGAGDRDKDAREHGHADAVDHEEDAQPHSH